MRIELQKAVDRRQWVALAKVRIAPVLRGLGILSHSVWRPR
jgi:hypothetical protein